MSNIVIPVAIAMAVSSATAFYAVKRSVFLSDPACDSRIKVFVVASFIALGILGSAAFVVMERGGEFRPGGLGYGAALFLIGLLSGTVLACLLALFVVNRYVMPALRDRAREVHGAAIKDRDELLCKQVEDWVSSQRYLEPNMTIMRMAKEIGTNRTYLSAFINDRFGKPFKQWIQAFRLEYAEKLMLSVSVNVPIKEISFRSGFAAAASFSAAFKNKHGIPPAQWREARLGPRHRPYKSFFTSLENASSTDSDDD